MRRTVRQFALDVHGGLWHELDLSVLVPHMNDAANPAPTELNESDGVLALVTAMDGMMADAVASQVAALYPNARLHSCASLSLAAQYPDTQIVLAILPPIEAVARRLVAGDAAEAALAAWLGETAPLLAAGRRLRRRLWLVDARAMAAGQAVSIMLPGARVELVQPVPTVPLPPAATLVIAALLIAQNPDAERLAAEISAMVRGPHGVVVEAGLLAAAHAEVAGLMADRAELTVRVGAARIAAEAQEREADLLRANLQLQLDRAETEARARATLEADVAIAKAELIAQMDAAQAAAAQQLAETDLLRANLQLQLDRAETEARTRATLGEDIAKLTADRARLTAEAETDAQSRATLEAEVATLTVGQTSLAAQIAAADAEAAERRKELDLLRENLVLQLAQADAESQIRAARDKEIAGLALTRRELTARVETEVRTSAALDTRVTGLTAKLDAEAQARAAAEGKLAQVAAARADLNAQLDAAQQSAAEQNTEAELLRENLLLQLDRGDAEARLRASLEAETAEFHKLEAAHALLAAEAEALRHRLAEAAKTQRRRETVIGRILLSDQRASASLRARAEKLADRLTAAGTAAVREI